ncbi:D-alanyl-D-alanine carboxypeptidase (penicillin-binding protein 5/6) [Agrococcus baldri]|uniref:D-alanyl-D-alanine carboxypeptidase (Penicillin-binding protein 5/6) n=1 Tax=Agrococcus baldri TaxID=153730 RepID=A0AA94L0K8_9MICO|nr:D-alanyl-D-alanine carboxypeptidase [Agrococcus baldri]SFS18299.1 D-alanyl-D-alanine carboxypeptidase (penicillin-binding protein 5/6) [Agrococcus baldri]
MSSPAVTAVTQRRRRTHPLVLLLRWAVLLALIVAVVAATAIAFAPAPRVAATPIALPEASGAPVSVAWPEGIARSAGYAVVGIDAAQEHWGDESAVPMASLTKLVTVLTVLEAHPIAGDDRGAAITLGRADINALGAAIAEAAPVVPVYDGMVVAQRDLIEWSLVDSAGNAMWSLANWAFGSIDAYLAAANDWAARNGLADTVVADPSGLSLESRSTAADMTELGLLAVADPVVLAAIGMERVAVPGGTVANTNPLLGEGFIDGGKTGTLRVWGRNLFVTAERDIEGEPRRAVAVIMGVVTQDDMNAAMLALVESLWDDFGTVALVPAGTPVAEYRAPWGGVVEAATVADLHTDAFGPHLPTAHFATAEAVQDGIEVAAPRGQVGTVVVEDIYGVTTQVPVRTDAMLAAPDLGWRLTHPSTAVEWYFD